MKYEEIIGMQVGKVTTKETGMKTAMGLWSKRITGLAAVLALAGTLAHADVTITTARQFNVLDGLIGTDADGVKNGVLTIDGNLYLSANGSINCNDIAGNNQSACPITIVVSGSMAMAAGSAIYAEERLPSGTGNGGNITISVGEDFDMFGPVGSFAGAIISASKTSSGPGKAGNIAIAATNNVNIPEGAQVLANATIKTAGAIQISGENVDVDGLVHSIAGQTGTGAVQPPGGGPITIIARCLLNVSDTGEIVSRGQDPGADLVHLEGCDVTIFGLVESSGVGHGVPNSPPTKLNSVYRPDKPSNSTAGVEIWGGNSILIDALGGNGEIKADTGQSPGGSSGTSWIDIFCMGDIKITGNLSGNYAVHANGKAGNDNGGIVTVKSIIGQIETSGLALQASCLQNGGSGGEIIVEAGGGNDAFGSILFGAASIQARGVNSGGGSQAGGFISARSYNGAITGAAPGELNADGGDGDGQTNDVGVVVLQSCTGVAYTGAITPSLIDLSPSCGGVPALEQYVVLPDCEACEEGGGGDECHWCNKGAVLSQVWQNMGGNTNFCDAIPDLLVDIRSGDTNVNPAAAGTSEPATGSIQAAVDYIIANGDLNGDGYLFIGVIAQDPISEFGPGQCLPEGTCSRPPNGPAGIENVVIRNTRSERLNVFGCSVTVAAKDPSLPVVTIEDSVGKVTVLDIHVVGSSVAGYLVQNNADLVIVKNSRSKGSDRGYWIKDDKVEITGSPEISGNRIGIDVQGSSVNLRSNKSIQFNTELGIKVVGNSNDLNGNAVGEKAKGNANGIYVSGNSNKIRDNDVYGGAGYGITAVGNANSITSNDVGEKDKGNGGVGITAVGTGLLLDGNGVFANGGDGIVVAGGTAASPNVIKRNNIGDRGKGNGGTGLVLGGVGNGTTSPIEVENNKAIQNGMSGIVVIGTGHSLKSNTSGGSGDKTNGDCEYSVAAGNFNAGSNKADDVTVAGSPAFATGCLGSP